MDKDTGVESGEDTDREGKDPHKLRGIVSGVLLVAVLGGLPGACLGKHLERRRIAEVSSKHVYIDGSDIKNLDTCSLGCRTEQDVTCEKFIELFRK